MQNFKGFFFRGVFLVSEKLCGLNGELSLSLFLKIISYNSHIYSSITFIQMEKLCLEIGKLILTDLIIFLIPSIYHDFFNWSIFKQFSFSPSNFPIFFSLLFNLSLAFCTLLVNLDRKVKGEQNE